MAPKRKGTLKKRGRGEETIEKGKKSIDFLIDEKIECHQLSDIGEDGNEIVKCLKVKDNIKQKKEREHQGEKEHWKRKAKG